MDYSPIGEVCVSLGLMKVDESHQVLDRMASGERARFGEVAMEMGLLDESGLALALAEQYRLNVVPEARLDAIDVPEALLEVLPRTLIRQNLVVPIFQHTTGPVVSVVVADPTDVPAIRTLHARLPGARLRFFVASRSAVRQLIDRLVGWEEDGDEPIEALGGDDAADLPATQAVVLEPDSYRLDLLRRLDSLEAACNEFVQDPEQVASLLAGSTIRRLICRSEVEGVIQPYLPGWRRLRPDLQVVIRSGFGPDSAAVSDHPKTTRYYLDLLEFAFAGAEQANLDARIRLHRTVCMARSVATRLGISQVQVDAVVLVTLLAELEGLSLARVLTQDLTDHPGTETRFHLVRRMLAAWGSPFDVNSLLDALERRTGGGGPIGAHIGAEVIYTVRALVRRSLPGDTDPSVILGGDVYHHFPRVLSAAADVLVSEAHASAMPSGQPEDRPFVLVALRDAALLTALEIELGASGFQVVAATDSAQVQRLARLREPRCILLDFALPRLGGLDLLRQLRASGVDPEVPIVFLAAPVPGPEVAEALEKGADDVVQRPVSFRLLVTKLRRLASRQPEVADALQGRLQDMPLPDVIQTLTLGGRTAVLRVRSEERSGELYIVKGQLHAARYGDVVGEQALRALVTLGSGSFRAEFGALPSERNLHGASEWLLLEALRIQDEATGESE